MYNDISDSLAKLTIKSAVHKRVLKGVAKEKKKRLLLKKNVKEFVNGSRINDFKMILLKRLAKLDPKQSKQEIDMHKEVVQKFAKKHDVPLSKLIRALARYGIDYRKMKYKNGFASATPSTSNNEDTPTKIFRNMKI